MENEFVTDDKYADFKNILNKWAEEKSNGRIKNFGEKIEIIDVDDGGVIKFDYRTRYVRREFEENCVMSFDGEDIPESVSKPLELWEYNTEGDNHNGKDDKIITEAEYEEEFKRLQAKIELAENDNNIIKLWELNSDIEKYNTYETFLESKFKENRACYPLKETFKLAICPRCAGRGKIPCSRCEGSGKILEYGKRVYCPSCEGAKNEICRICHGKEKVVKYTALYEYFTFEDETKFIKTDNLPEILSNGVESLDGYETDSNDGIVINQFNSDAIFEHLDEMQKNLSADEAMSYKMIAEEIKFYMASKSKDLDFNTRINQLTIKNFSLEFKIVKYRFNQKEYTVLIYGKDNKVYAPKDTYLEEDSKQYSEEIKVSEKKNDIIQMYELNSDKEIDNKKCNDSQKDENCNSSKKRFICFVLCLFLGLLGIHRFYVGKIISGIIQLLLPISAFILMGVTQQDWFLIPLIFCFFWYFVDLLIILFGKFKDTNKQFIKKW